VLFKLFERSTRTGLRGIIGMALALFLVTSSAVPAFAQTATTGTISGTVTDSAGVKLASVGVTAVAPSSRYTATTNKAGFFSMIGVQPDTYTITFQVSGYEEYRLTGVTVSQNSAVDASAALRKGLVTIGRTSSRSSGAAFQPKQTTDQYTIGTQQIQTTLGKSGGTNESNLLASVPGASFDSSGYPVLRGGRENEEGFQFEGIDYTDAFTSQFVNSLLINGAANFQVTPGAGDASIGNAGTGQINVIAKRGTHPAFGQIEADVYAPFFDHAARGEYGFATPDGRLSNYFSFTGDRRAQSYAGSNALMLGEFLGRSYQWDNDFVENAVYKFGKDNNQSLQFFYDNTQLDIRLGYGSSQMKIPFTTADPYYLHYTPLYTGLSKGQIQQLQPFTPGQQSVIDYLGSDTGTARAPENYNQPNETFKLQYSITPDASTYISAKYYHVNAVSLFDFPYIPLNLGFDDEVALQGGLRSGFAVDGTRQFGSKNIVGFGGKYEYLHPVYSQPSGSAAIYEFTGNGGVGYSAADFLPNNGSCPLGPNACGYLLGQLPGQPTAYIDPNTRLPYSSEGTGTNRQDFALYVKDTYSPTDRVKLDAGLRMDGSNYRYEQCNIENCLPTSIGETAGVRDPSKDVFAYDQSTRTPRVLEPRFGASFQFTKNDAFHVNYGRSVTFAPLAQIDLTGERFQYAAYQNVPSYDATTGGPAMFCGTTFDVKCKNYADELYWENAAYIGIPIQPLKPETFNNWEIGLTHQFANSVAVKLTPFYRKAFNAFAQTRSPIVKNGVTQLDPFGNPLLGPSVSSNLGNSQITGVEFYATKEAAYGLSGSLSLTYQNEFSNVIPGSSSEDFFPSIPPASLALGNTYRVGFLSPFVGTLAVQYKSHSGWRVNPVLYYNHGYPIGVGTLTANTVNGVAYNIPNTNVANANGSTGAYGYIDPRNPGTYFAPNIDATRGTPEASSSGGVLSASRMGPAQITVEFTPPRNQRSTYGVLVSNLFNQLYGQPAYNGRYAPVATGVAGPFSGYTSTATVPGYIDTYNYVQRNGNQAYLLTPNGTPRSFQFYYQLSI
jgi:hypothetical protein